MLTSRESSGLKSVLDTIPDDELFSLLETVTNRMFTTRKREEAIGRIICCTLKASDLLRRQKMTKKIIFNYLLNQGIPGIANLEKRKLISKCLELWDSSDSCKGSDYSVVENGEKFSNETSEFGTKSDNSDLESGQISLNERSEFGVQFACWFFSMLNKLDGFSAEHFWPTCSLQAQLFNIHDEKEVTISGANDVADFLSKLIILDKYTFVVNAKSVILDEDHYGLVRIGISGTLHQNSNAIGLFDSAFGLIKNPDCQNTYKIQLVKLKMCVNTAPGLPGSNFPAVC